MSHEPISVVLAALLLVASLASCAKEPALSDDYDYKIDMNEYESAVLADGSIYLALVNKQNPVESTYTPAALSALPTELTLYGKSVELEATVAVAAEALIRELHAQGYDDIRITSGYRTYTYQQTLFNTYLSQEMANHPDWTQDQCEAEVLTYSARPGTSEHQTGLCMDLISVDHVVLDESFAENPAYAYLWENAHHFGFVLRFPEGKEAVTGYSYEPWHFRFVGIRAATEIHNEGLTLEEYLG